MNSVADDTRAWAERRGLSLTFTESTGSTNDDAKRDSAGRSGEHLHLTAHQSAGRGRGRNTWSDGGGGAVLLATWCLPVAGAPQAITAPRIGLGLFRAARRAWPNLPWALKAPNDLYLATGKVAGLLVEVVSSAGAARLHVGLGLNVRARPREVASATDVASALGRVPTDGEWFSFLDAWTEELRRARLEITEPRLSDDRRRQLRLALNALPQKSFEIDEVSPEGDLVHAGGIVRWTEL